MVAGAFITAGALFSLLLATGVGAPGPKLLLEGIGFSSGFFFVILSDAALFTEANVAMPATLLAGGSSIVLWVVWFWVLAFVGNLVGAVAVGWTVHLVQHYPGELGGELQAVIQRKLAWRQIGGMGAWFQIVGSGILANWLVGMAAFFSVMGRTIFGKYIPVMLAVTLFVSANLQHSPANMGYFSLATSMGIGPGWGTALGWNIVPAAYWIGGSAGWPRRASTGMRRSGTAGPGTGSPTPSGRSTMCRRGCARWWSRRSRSSPTLGRCAAGGGCCTGSGTSSGPPAR